MGTNTLVSVFGQVARPLDSTLTAFLAQLGVLGAGLFYGALALASWRSPSIRPLMLTLVLASFVSNVGETFPANLLLA